MNETYITRNNDIAQVRQLLDVFPVTAILGPRQAGKTTLAQTFQPDHIFDLENPRDAKALENPQLTLEHLRGLIMIDEIQRQPELFPLIRYLVDHYPNQRYLLLGSASSNIRQQSGESLAGRIGYHYLSGLSLVDVGESALQNLWLKGGFPRSLLAGNDAQSLLWRKNFISTFLEKDIAGLRLQIPAPLMYRFWLMISHYHAQTLNYSEIGRSFNVSDKTVKHYLSLLEDTFMIRLLMPWHTNLGKRLVKSPKLYLRDSGLFHALQDIPSFNSLITHPKIGASWEGFALEQTISTLAKRDSEVFFYATHAGVELDLFWQSQGNNFGMEFKYADAPHLTKSMRQVLADLALQHLWVVYPGDRQFPIHEQVTVLPLAQVGSLINS
ncbi:MAG TPA: ATP-binding protein [Saprospiraceae bacterium]|nr:ATP-binding protein [Saprospiraceae bacterium]HMQ83825.1 ATP-binding protein [Saprospiraceae bacterium]